MITAMALIALAALVLAAFTPKGGGPGDRSL